MNDSNSPPSPLRYLDAGVNIDAKHGISKLIRKQVARTFGPQVVDVPGGFAGLFQLDTNSLFGRNYRKPLLVGCCDGVGTKIIIAQMAGKLDTIGIDCVAMNVNDLIVMGAEPLFFLDYLAVNKITDQMMLSVLKGVSDGCVESSCALLGGETADMPDVYDKPGEFDLAGFAVGIVEQSRYVTGETIRKGDAIIGLSSSGVHSNGYGLVRKIVFERLGLKPDDPMPGFENSAEVKGRRTEPKKIQSLGPPSSVLRPSVADVLLTPTRIYVKAVRAVLRNYRVKKVVKGMAHITGGGLPGNVNRVLPKHLNARIRKGSWPIPRIFSFLQANGPVAEEEMYRVFNMGIGYTLIVAPKFAKSIMTTLRRAKYQPHLIGEIVPGQGEVELV